MRPKLAKFDATFDTEGLQAYIQQNRDELLARIMLEGRTIDRISIRRNIKTSEAIHYFDMPITFQDGRGCEFTPDGGAAVLTDRILATALIKVNKEFCPDDLLGSYAEALVKISATEEELPFEEFIGDYIVKKISEQLEKAIWQGDTESLDPNLSQFNGFLKGLAGEDDVIVVESPQSASAYNRVKAVFMALPEEAIEQNSAAIHVSPAIFRAFMQDLVEKNLYHYQPGEAELEEFPFPGSEVKVVKTLGLSGVTPIVGSFDRNLFYGCDDENDKRELVIDYDKKAGSYYVRVRWNSGVQVAFPDMVVVGVVSETPDVPVESISLNKGATTIAVAGEETLVATVLPADATDPSVTWSSNNEEVATVDENGKVTGVTAGVAVIMAQAGAFVDACAVTVTE